MLRTIHLYGDLEEKYGGKHKLNVNSIAEVMKAMNANHPGFLKSIKSDGQYEVVRGDTLNDEHLCDELLEVNYAKGDFHIAPAVEGSGGDSGIVMLILGVVLIGIGLFTGQLWLVGIGASLAIGGVGQMLAVTPDVQKEREKKESFHFDGPVNSGEQGGVLPIVYGRMVVGSTVVSAGISADNFSDVLYGMLKWMM